MKRIALTLVETLIVMVITAILISITTAGWAVITRGIRDHAVLDSAVQGIIFVLTDARGRSVETKIPQWVRKGVDEESKRVFASGTENGATSTVWKIPETVEIQFASIDPFDDTDFFYVFGAWAGDTGTTYQLIDGPATITVSLENSARTRLVVVDKGLAKEP